MEGLDHTEKEEEDPDEPDYAPSQEPLSNYHSHTHLQDILPINAISDKDIEGETLSSSIYQSLFEDEDTPHDQTKIRKENIIDYFGLNEDEALSPLVYSTEEIKFLIKNNLTGKLEPYKTPSNETPHNLNYIPFSDSSNYQQFIPDKDLGFRAILSNTKKRVNSMDMINNLATINNAGIVILTEPNLKKSLRDNYFTSIDNKVAVRTNRNLLGAPEKWNKDTNFCHFHWKDIMIVCCYLNPNDSNQSLELSLLKIEKILKEVNKKTIVVGDFNGRSSSWGDIVTNARGRIIEDWMISNNLQCLNDSDNFIPTFVGHRGESVVDLIFATEDIYRDLEIKVMDDESLSDHKAVLINYKKNIGTSNFLSKPSGWFLDPTKYKNFNREVKIRVDQEHEPLTPEICNRIITESADVAFSRKDKINNHKLIYWWNNKIKKLNKTNQRLRAKIKYFRSLKRPTSILQTKLKDNRKNMDKEITESKRIKWKKMISDLDNDIWGNGYKIASRKLKSPISYDSNTISNEESIKIITDLFPAHPTQEWIKPNIDNADIPPVSREEILNSLKKLKANKSPGPDAIPQILVKFFVAHNIERVRSMIDKMMKTSVFPSEWKRAKLILLEKTKKKSTDPKKYRPICILNAFSKIFEYVLQERLLNSVTLSERQYGFRKGRSTIQAMKRVIELYEINRKTPYNKRSMLCLIGIDVKNAFNSLRWADIISELKKQNVPAYLVAIMQSYLEDRFVESGELIFQVTAGSFQGSIIGPLLWNIVYDPIVKSKTDPQAEKIAYADDLLQLLLTKDKNTLLRDSNRITSQTNKQLKKKGLTMECSKTESLILEGKRKDCDGAMISVDGKILEVGTSLRYLGFFLDKGLSMSHHLKTVCEKTKRVANHFRSIMPNIDGPTFLKRSLVIHAILSILWYGVEIWAVSCNRKKNIKLVTSTIRPLKRGLCCAYRTVSNSVLDVLTDLPPTDLLIERKLRKIKKEEDKLEIEVDINKRWNTRWMTAGDQNDRWLHKLLPSLQIWMERTHGETDFFLSQFMSGHGCFNSYLNRFKLTPSPLCALCLAAEDTPEHAFFDCNAVENLKKTLEKELNSTISPENTISLMLVSTEFWNKIHTFITKVIRLKMKHSSNHNTPTLHSVAAGEISPNRDDSGIIRAVM
ncbi:hypothetical protein BC332_34546 [Capsicum chinense]|nr:hypothetical protein BC332_34546 [Capsicum chinense]